MSSFTKQLKIGLAIAAVLALAGCSLGGSTSNTTKGTTGFTGSSKGLQLNNFNVNQPIVVLSGRAPANSK